MEPNHPSETEIRDYLLGRSPAETSSTIDELSFTDDYSERIGSVEHDLVDAYIYGELSSEDLIAFEEHYLSSRRRWQGVEFARAFQAHAAALTNKAVNEQVASEGTFFAFFKQLLDRRRIFQYGLAFSGIVIAVSLGIAFFRSGQQDSQDVASVEPPQNITKVTSASVEPEPSLPQVPEPAQPQGLERNSDRQSVPSSRSTSKPVKSPTVQPRIATIFLSPALRSASFQTIEVPDGRQIVEFGLGLEGGEAGPFRARIIDLNRNVVVWSANVARVHGTGANRSARLRAPSRALGHGDYQISLTTDDSSGEPEKIGDYYFRIAP